MYSFEDLVPGLRFRFGPKRISAEEIIAFAAQFDPQPMHLGPDKAHGSMLGEFIASGWHTCAIMMRLFADGLLNRSTAMGSGGIDEVRWLKPLRPNDTVMLDAEVMAARASRSRPEMGIVTFRWSLSTQREETVADLVCPIMFGRRVPAEAEG
jgi:acyl dehydratase